MQECMVLTIVARFPRYGKYRKIMEIEYEMENMENPGK